MTVDRGILQQLRATLRLGFEPEQADELASRFAPQEADLVTALQPVIRLARLSYSTARWLSLVKRGDSAANRPLRPSVGLAAVPALELALHLGLDLDVESLGELFHRTPNDVGADLQRARQHLVKARATPCPEFVSAVGRYRDPVDDRLERLTYLQHVEHCERCRTSLDDARQLDDRLLAAIEQYELTEPKALVEGSIRRLWLRPALLWGGGGLLVILILLVGLTAARAVFGGNHTPVPLQAAAFSNPQYTGWLLEKSARGRVEAVNLATGARRLLIQGADGSNVALSPDHASIAQLLNGASGPKLGAYNIDGTLQHEWPKLDQSSSYELLGWLNANEILVAQTPGKRSDEDQATYDARVTSESSLEAFNVQSGRQQTLMQAQVDAVFPSPDGQYVAIQHIVSAGSVTLEIWSIQNDALGKATATLPNMTFANADSQVLWTPDSQHVVFWARGIVDPNTNSTPYDIMTLDGQIRTIATAPGSAFGSLLAISPDGTSVLYAEGETGTTSAPWAYWQMSIADGTTTKLMDGGDLGRLVPVQRGWRPIVYVGSPNQTAALLTTAHPFYLPKAEQDTNINSVISYVTQAFDQRGQSIGPLLDEFTPQDLLGWVPTDALAALPAASPDPGPFQSTIGNLNYPPLNADSHISPDGSAVLSPGEGGNFSMAVSLNATTGAPSSLAGAPDDPSWLPDGSGVIGVQRHTTGNGSISRISIFGDSGNGTYALIDFDPDNLGNYTGASYRLPMLSPNGLRYSFFVVEGGAVTLWVSGRAALPQRVANWSIPSSAKVDLPLIAAWFGNDTLVFAEPGDWVKGYPRQTSLRRISFDENGGSTPDTLLHWNARGGEQGILLQDLRPSPDGSQLALRLRRLTGTNLTTDRFDSISVAPITDLTRSTELAKGVAGEGMSWSPDGTELAAFIDGGLTITPRDGGHSQAIDTGDVTYAYPIWAHPNEIWIEAIVQNGQHVSFGGRVTR